MITLARALSRLLLALAPLLLAAWFAWRLVAVGDMDFGAGDKDIFYALPLLLWSLAYLCAFLALWWRGWGVARSLVASACIATAFTVIVLLVLLGILWLQSRH